MDDRISGEGVPGAPGMGPRRGSREISVWSPGTGRKDKLSFCPRGASWGEEEHSVNPPTSVPPSVTGPHTCTLAHTHRSSPAPPLCGERLPTSQEKPWYLGLLKGKTDSDFKCSISLLHGMTVLHRILVKRDGVPRGPPFPPGI